MLCCVRRSVVHSDTCTHIEQLLNLHVGLCLDFVIVCLCRFNILRVICVGLVHFIPVLLAFVALDLFSSVPSQEINGWEERLRK